jgi:hypothetical protein
LSVAGSPTKGSLMMGLVKVCIIGRELVQSTLYACMEISQQNPFVQLIYTNKTFASKSIYY